MTASWTLTPLRKALKRVERFEPRLDLVEYPFAGTYSYAKGVFVSERKIGASFKLPKVQRIRAGDFVYCKIMAWEGAFGTVPMEADGCVMSGAFVAYEPVTPIIEPKFLDWYFRAPSNWQRVGRQSTGTNVRRQSLHPEQFEATEIPLPPIDEQRRIVARIEDVAKKVEEARHLRSRLGDERTALQRSIVSSFLTAATLSGREVCLPEIGIATRRNVEIPTKVNAVAASWDVPKGWLRVSVGELLLRGALLDVKDGNHGSNHPKSAEFSDNGTPFLMASDIANGNVLWDGAALLPVTAQSRLRIGFSKAGDVLFTHKASIGKTALSDRPSILSPQVTYYRCNTNYISPSWLTKFLGSDLFLYQLTDIQKQSTRDFVSISKQYQQFVLLPPLDQQHHISTEVDALQAKVDVVKSLQAETAAELDAMLPAILDKAFKGEL
jgi:type I restriction enzyme S subunit